jgi:hypothetical protein
MPKMWQNRSIWHDFGLYPLPLVKIDRRKLTKHNAHEAALTPFAESGIHLAPVAIRARQVYQTSFGNGLSAAEIQNHSPAANETNRLWSYLESRLQLSLQSEGAKTRLERTELSAKGVSAAS